MPTCFKCGCDCESDELRDLAGKEVCEDCFLDGVEITKTCDPWVVHLGQEHPGGGQRQAAIDPPPATNIRPHCPGEGTNPGGGG